MVTPLRPNDLPYKDMDRLGDGVPKHRKSPYIRTCTIWDMATQTTRSGGNYVCMFMSISMICLCTPWVRYEARTSLRISSSSLAGHLRCARAVLKKADPQRTQKKSKQALYIICPVVWSPESGLGYREVSDS